MIDQFNVRSRLEDGFTVIVLSGELDAESNSAEKNLLEIIAQGFTAFLIDCEALSYISSAGVSVFLAMRHACHQKKATIAFVNLQPKIKDVLQIIGLYKVLHIAGSLEEAKALLSANQPV